MLQSCYSIEAGHRFSTHRNFVSLLLSFYLLCSVWNLEKVTRLFVEAVVR